ncbi:MAG: (2Fe-2S)-binding protein [Vicinamibacteria bacterium]
MIVCHCRGITDRDIRSLVREGRAKTVLAIGRDCSAGLGCGGCRLAVEHIVRQEERTRLEAVLTELAPAL